MITFSETERMEEEAVKSYFCTPLGKSLTLVTFTAHMPTDHKDIMPLGLSNFPLPPNCPWASRRTVTDPHTCISRDEEAQMLALYFRSLDTSDHTGNVKTEED
jgi:hypothetical protein